MMEKIDLSQYVRTGEGANGSSYDSILDPDMMVKMYNTGYDTDSIVTELEVARKVYALGIPSPEPGVLVTDGERTGIRFRRIIGKRSFARAIADEPLRVDEYTREFARYCKRLHSVECPEGQFPDAKKDFLRMLDKSGTFSPDEKSAIRDFIMDGIPECSTALHGDMHVGNVLTTLPKGAPLDTPHQVYFIDLGYFSYGCPLMDLGMLGNICNYSDDGFLYENFHFRRPVALQVWDSFVQEYFFGEEKLGEKWFGSAAAPSRMLELLEPYILVKLLLVEYNIGSMPASYLELVHRAAANLASARHPDNRIG